MTLDGPLMTYLAGGSMTVRVGHRSGLPAVKHDLRHLKPLKCLALAILRKHTDMP